MVPTRVWVGPGLSALAVLFLLMDTTMQVLKLAPAVEGTVQLGHPESAVEVLGLIELVCLGALRPPADVGAGGRALSPAISAAP